MTRRRVMVLFGTRPEAIKLAPVIQALGEAPELEPVVCVTGQHRQMLDQVLEVFQLTPDHDLDLMTPGQDLSGLTAALLTALSPVLRELKPDCLVVHGDTTTTFAGALAAYYHGIPCAHVEAGLRTGNKRAPFPEELNRRLVGSLADLHFAPTALARDALLAEGVSPETVHVTGNTAIDALLWVKQRLDGGQLRPQLPESAQFENYVLITAHRRESFGVGFESLCAALADLAARFPDLGFVYPVHLNPNVQEPVHRLLAGIPNMVLCEPVDYVTFVALMANARLILTDSGGVQEEAPSFGNPVLVLRETTERPEAVTAGLAHLVGMDRGRIVREASGLLEGSSDRSARSVGCNPYGDGQAASRITRILQNHRFSN